ncbi:MAG: inositol monophosphatase [Hyphomicrobiaceae bacterium]
MRKSLEGALRAEIRRLMLGAYESHEESASSLKGDNSPVSAVDLASQELISSAIRRISPRCVVLSEECFDWNVFNNRDSVREMWIIDPLDGTRIFLSKKPEFGVMIARLVSGKPVNTWLYYPVDDFLIRIEEAGVFVNDQQVRLNAGNTNEQRGVYNLCYMNIDDARLVLDRLQQIGGFTSDICSSWEYRRLCCGENEFYLNSYTTPWDTIAGVHMFRTLGGYVESVDGPDYEIGDVGKTLLYAPSRGRWEEFVSKYLVGVEGPAMSVVGKD